MKYEFDARRYCQANMERMGKTPNGVHVGELIIGEINTLRARVARLEEALSVTMARTEHGVSPEIYAIARRALEEK